MANDFLSTIGGGSGLNITELTESLVSAERAPSQAIIDRSKEKAEVKISAYGVVKNSISTLQSAFAKLDDVSDLTSFFSQSSDETVVTADVNSEASAGSYEIQTTVLAARDNWVFDGVPNLTSDLAAAPLVVTITKDGTPSEITVSDRTLTGIMAAINDAGFGLTATIIDTQASDGRYRLSVAGETGSDNSFSLIADGLSNPTQTSNASDLQFSVNGVDVSRSANSVSDLLDGVTVNFRKIGTSVIEISSDTSVLKASLLDMVTTFNAVQSVFNTLRSDDGSGEELAGTLGTDSSFRSIVSQIRNTLTAQISTSSGDINYLTDMGIGFNREGFLEVNEAVLDATLASDLSDVVTALSADTDQQTIYGAGSRGLAGDMFVMLDTFIRSNGVITSTVQNAESRLLSYESDLLELDSRMERLKTAYLSQFSAMERIVGQMNSTSEYLTNQLAVSNKD